MEDGTARPSRRRLTLFAPLFVLFVALAAWNLSITLRAEPQPPPEETNSVRSAEELNSGRSPAELACDRAETASGLVDIGEIAEAEFFADSVAELATESVPELIEAATALEAAVAARDEAAVTAALVQVREYCDQA